MTCESLDASGGARVFADQATEDGFDADATGRIRRAAVVVHPGKHHDLVGFRAVVVNAMADLGWEAPLWLETSPDDTGERLAGEAVRSGVDLVIASGGDGTVIACASGVTGTGIPLGVLPSGTGNLLARNLGLPLDLDEALTIALTGAQRWLDVGVVNERPFVVMAGLGFDAEMIAGAGEGLKRLAGWAAYAVSALRHLWDRPTRVVLRADGGPPLRRWASAVIVGNVGTLQGSVRLLPDAVPDDGVLDVAVLTAWGLLGWLGLAADVLLLRTKTTRLTRLTCRELVVDARRARPWEADGDVIGLARQLKVSVQAQSLLVRVPAGPVPHGPHWLPRALAERVLHDLAGTSDHFGRLPVRSLSAGLPDRAVPGPGVQRTAGSSVRHDQEQPARPPPETGGLFKAKVAAGGTAQDGTAGSVPSMLEADELDRDGPR